MKKFVAVLLITVLLIGLAVSCKPDSIVPVTGVSLNYKQYVFNNVGETLQLIATVYPENASNKNVIWSSLEPDEFSVDENGLVKALVLNDTTITVTTVDGSFTAQCGVSVQP